MAWVMERYTARYDEPNSARVVRLGALTTSGLLAASPPPPAADVAGTATWPIDVSVSEISDTTWTVTFTLNRSPAPPELATYSVAVTVVDGDVIGETSIS